MGTVPIVPKFDKKTQENICDGIFSPSIPTLTPTFKETKACPTPHILTRGYTIRTRQPLLPISSSYQKIRLVKEDLSRIDGKRKKVSDMTDSNRMKYDQPVRSCVRVSIDNDQIRLAHRVRDDPKGIYLETYLCNHQNPIDFIFNLDSRWNSDFLISRKTKYIGSEHDIHSLTSDLKSLIYLYSSEGSSFCKWHHLTDETQSTFQFVTDCADNYQFVCLNPFWENEAVCISGQGRVVLVGQQFQSFFHLFSSFG
ncbi:hypothetical protein ACOME3_006630 [Neoechinorhynchus agilis]